MNNKDLALFEHIAEVANEKERETSANIQRLVDENRMYRNYLKTIAYSENLDLQTAKMVAKHALGEE